MEMQQAVYLCLMHWFADVPSQDHFEHIARWRVGNTAYQHLHVSSAAWSPSRAAIVRLALRLLLCSGVRDLEWNYRMAAQLNRQQRRAMAPLLILDPLDTVTHQVRQLVRAHRVEQDVLHRLLRLHPQLRGVVGDLRAAAAQRMVEDNSSSSEDEL